MGKLTNLTVKGQVTIPKDVRDALGLLPGEPVAIEMRGANEAVIRKGVIDPVERERRRAERRQAIEEARRFALPMDMSTNEYMTMIREPVPIPDNAE